MPKSNAERLRDYRKRLKENPEKYEEVKRKHREYMRSVRPSVKDLPEQEKNKLREQWKKSSEKKREKKKGKKCQKCQDLRKKLQYLEEHIKNLTRENKSIKKLAYRRKIKLNNMENFIRNTTTPAKPPTLLASASTAVTGAPLITITPSISVQPPSGSHEELTPMTQTNNFIYNTIPYVPEKEKERIKKKILQLNVLNRSLGQEYNNATDNKTRWVLKNVVSNDVTKKYKLKNELTKGLGLKGRIRKLTKKQKIYKEAKEIRDFFNRDDNTRMTAGKKDTKTFKKTKYQKRFLLQSLKRLYTKYVAEGGKASFSTFRRNKPIYVKRPKLSDRDTCVCIKHNNLSQKAIKLHKLRVIETHNLEELVTSVACNIDSYECMYNKCTSCKAKKPLLNVEVTDESECSWLEWQCKQYEYTKQNGDGTKNSQITKKYVNETRTGTLSELISLFTTELLLFKTHFFNIHYQYSKYREVIDNLHENELGILVDFSENYQCKLFCEIQAMHFGASRVQITLHTGVIYSKDYEPQSFVSISPNNDHNPGAIWAHLQPVVDYVKITFPKVNVLHFFSDGPTTQYRQKKNFYQLSQLLDQNGFSYGTWSFFEAAHGKGAADGVGGAIKRLLDQEVSHGNSVVDAMSAVNILKDITDVQIFYVPDSEIKEKQSQIPENLVPIQGTMRIHQIICHNNILWYRDLSCFCGVQRGICACIDVKTHNLIKQSKEQSNSNQESLAKRKKIVAKTRKRKISVTESDTEIDSDVTYAESDDSPYSTERMSDGDNINEAGVFQPTAKLMIRMSDPGPSSGIVLVLPVTLSNPVKYIVELFHFVSLHFR